MTAGGAHLPIPTILGRRPVLVTGGAGFIGSNLADRLAREGHNVLVYDALARPGVEANLAWLKQRHPHRISSVMADIRDEDAVAAAARDAEAVFHFAAQVAVTTSLVEPREDFDINVRGTLNVLDAVRRRGEPVPVIFASTNKVYGDLGDVALQKTNDSYVPVDAGLRASGIGESRPLDFHTPYGCSKGAADQYVLDYAKSYGLPSVVFRMSCIYGPHQHGNEDQGWVAHFGIRALEGRPITVYGDGAQVRDLLYVDDLVDAMLLARDNVGSLAGMPFNMGGGPENAVSLKEVLDLLCDLNGKPTALSFAEERKGDQRYYVADTRRFELATGWRPLVPAAYGIERLYRWLAEEHAPTRARLRAVAG
jgi:CDP-paratose 2-epimerase